MYNMKIYALYDNVAETHVGPILLYAGDPAAVRAMRDAATDPQSQMSQHLDDYELYEIGELIDLAGKPHITAKPARLVLEGKTLNALKTERERKQDAVTDILKNRKVKNETETARTAQGNTAVNETETARTAQGNTAVNETKTARTAQENTAVDETADPKQISLI